VGAQGTVLGSLRSRATGRIHERGPVETKESFLVNRSDKLNVDLVQTPDRQDLIELNGVKLVIGV
jgi:hypothetical protein